MFPMILIFPSYSARYNSSGKGFGFSESVAQGCSVRQVFLEIYRKINRKTPVPESLFNKIAGLSLPLY